MNVMTEDMQNRNKEKLNLVRGSLIGGAAGDALGYTVEFDRYNEIIAKYPSIKRV